MCAGDAVGPAAATPFATNTDSGQAGVIATTGAGPYSSLTDYVQENIRLVYESGDDMKSISGNKLTEYNFFVTDY